jgi:DNA-binding beta-propeller fold protein YncE
MRCLSIGLILVIPVIGFGDEGKARNPIQPVKVVALDRKQPVLYERDVEPILANKCQFCHSGSLTEGKFDMSSYESLMKGGKRGQPIVPGNSVASLLLKLAGRTERPIMPPRNEEPLTPEELALVKLWVNQGARGPSGASERRRTVVLTDLPPSVHPVRAITLAPDKSVLVAARGAEIHVYDTATGAYIRTLIDPALSSVSQRRRPGAHHSIVESLAFSPNGKQLASGSFQEVTLWDVATGNVVKRFTGFADRVVALALSPDGKLLATGGGAPSQDGEIMLFDVSDGKVIANIKNGHSDTVFGVAFSPDGAKLATCSADKFVKVFEVPSGKFVKAFEGHTNHVLDVGWKSDGKLLVSAGADNVVKVWDYEKGEQVRTFGNHSKQITRLVFKGKSPEIATCSGDQTVRFWNIDNGGAGMTFGGSTDFLYAVTVSADGKIVAAGGEEGIVRLYNGTNGQLIKALLPPDAQPTPAGK